MEDTGSCPLCICRARRLCIPVGPPAWRLSAHSSRRDRGTTPPRPVGEKDLAIQMNARPVLGIDNDVLWATAQRFGADACGEDVWDGKKLAILNILNPISGIGHYVVALRSDASGAAVVYCPYYARTIRLTAPWLKDHWRSGDSLYKNWAITFPQVVPDDVVAICEEWPEMGLAAGEANPYWLLRSAHRFLANAAVE